MIYYDQHKDYNKCKHGALLVLWLPLKIEMIIKKSTIDFKVYNNTVNNLVFVTTILALRAL